MLSRNSLQIKRIVALQQRTFSSSKLLRQAAVIGSKHLPTAEWRSIDSGSDFTVSETSGFLPRQDPLAKLPSYFEKLEEILHEMPMYKGDGTYGLLHNGRLGDRIERELPVYDVGFIFDHRILSALFRDYTFLASAYLLEPCDIQYRLTRNYGLARRILPENIARPLEIVAARLNTKPFLEHSMSFTSYNYKRKDSQCPIDVGNIEPIRKFSGCETEKSHIVAHVVAASHTGDVVKASVNILRAIKDNDRALFDQSLKMYTDAMKQINDVMAKTLINTSEYASFRTFLSGSKDQPMFNNGIIFEGSLNNLPRDYFGVSQSSNPVASLSTHLFQLSNLSPLGKLSCSNGIDSHRPGNYQAFLNHINAESSKQGGIHRYALANPASTASYVAALDQVLAYRYRQWANLRESMPAHSSSSGKDASISGLERQTRHVKDIAELVLRTIANTDTELLANPQRMFVDDAAHRAEITRRTISRFINDPELTGLLPTSMIAY